MILVKPIELIVVLFSCLLAGFVFGSEFKYKLFVYKEELKEENNGN